MNRIKIAVLDDGVCTDSAVLAKRLDFDMQCHSGVIQPRCRPVMPGSHGTVVADLICAYGKSVQIGSVQVMLPKERGSIRDVLCAARWCVDHGADVVHMSIGTKQWQDFFQMERVIVSLAEKIPVVAAKNNSKEFSLPSGISVVWDVSFKLSGGPVVRNKQRGAYGIETNLWVPKQAACKYGNLIGSSNSYQAALVTGFLADNGLLQRPVSRQSLYDELAWHCRGYGTSMQKTDRTDSSGTYRRLEEIAVVWICIEGKAEEGFQLLREFHKQDYYAIAAAQQDLDRTDTMFWKCLPVINKEQLCVLAEEYQCDLILAVSHQWDLAELADYTLHISDAKLCLYGKCRRLLASAEKTSGSWQTAAAELVIRQYEKEIG